MLLAVKMAKSKIWITIYKNLVILMMDRTLNILLLNIWRTVYLNNNILYTVYILFYTFTFNILNDIIFYYLILYFTFFYLLISENLHHFLQNFCLRYNIFLIYSNFITNSLSFVITFKLEIMIIFLHKNMTFRDPWGIL